MIKLAPPKSQLWLTPGDSRCHWDKLEKRCREHPFNHAVEVFVPGVADLPEKLCPPLPVYYTAQLALSQFIQPELCHHIPSQSLAALSVGTRVDTDNVYAVLPSGKLILSVTKDTYEQLGLVGKPSRFQKQHRFLVEVDLTAPYFKPGKPNYDRVQWSLTERLGEKIKFVMCCSPSGGEHSGALQETELHSKLHGCVKDKHLVHNFPLPAVDSQRPHEAAEVGVSTSCSASDFHTWLGALTCGVDLGGEAPSDYVSTFSAPEPHSPCLYGTRVRWSGMVHSDWVCDLLLKARHYWSTGGRSDVPWVAVSVWGFEDAPISWYPSEHGSYLWGDNHYTVLLFPDGNYWTMTSLGSHDIIQ